MARLQKSDAIRIPVGVLFAWIGVLALLRGVPLFTGDATSIIIAVMSLIFGLIFLAIGAVMALGWLGAK